MQIDKVTFEFHQEADNEVGSESIEIIATPVLIGLFKEDGTIDHYFTIKTDGFSFNDKAEFLTTFDKIEKSLNQLK